MSVSLHDFYPPRMNVLLVRMFQQFLPLYARLRHRMTVHMSAEDCATLAAFQDQRVLLLPNHPPYYDDWVSVFILSARLRQSFYYLAAQERFRGLEGKLIQRLGAYSIRRGLGDRPSVAMTRQLLMQPACKLVIFPEGGCSYQNDTVMPFRLGAIQIAFQSVSKLNRQRDPSPAIYAVPLCIKYQYTTDMALIIDQTLSKLERALSVRPQPEATLYERLRTVAEYILDGFERQHQLPAIDGVERSLNERISRLRTYWVTSCEQRLGIPIVSDKPVRERVYKIQAALEEQAEQLATQHFDAYDEMHQIATNLLNFDAIYDGYVAASPTAERFLDTLIRLERYVFQVDYPPPKAHRRVSLQVAAPVNLQDYYHDYLGDRPGTIQQVTQQLQQSVQAKLDEFTPLNSANNGFLPVQSPHREG
jgi:1-acyl-sn-glycerol-3-phosphate acyltransferase